MEDGKTVRSYEIPQVTDYGDLQELTAACLGGTGGDHGYPGTIGGYTVGVSNPAESCKSRP